MSKKKMWLSLIILIVVFLACLAIWIFFLPEADASPKCSMDMLERCSVDEYNELCSGDCIDAGNTQECENCESHCQYLAQTAPTTIAKYHYCLRDRQYKHLSACHDVRNFATSLCSGDEYRAYCAGTYGNKLCIQRCLDASAAVRAPLIPDPWDYDIFCDMDLCAPLRVDAPAVKLCGPCFRSRDIGSDICKEQTITDREGWCWQYSSQMECQNYCTSATDDPLCRN
jgi:hypothetical protein